MGNGPFAAGPRRFDFSGGFRAFAEDFVDAVAGLFGFARPFRAFAGTFFAFTERFFAFTERLLGFAARFFIVNLPRAPSGPGDHPWLVARSSCPSHHGPARVRSDAIIRPMPAARHGEEFLRSCPVLAALPTQEAVAKMPGVEQVGVTITFEPRWPPDRIARA